MEEKLKEHKENFTKLNSYLAEIEKSLTQLLAEKERTKEKITLLNGAIQAYHEIMNDSKKVAPEQVVETT
jgi:uncharacterized coiled-coil DUF342 family protein